MKRGYKLLADVFIGVNNEIKNRRPLESLYTQFDSNPTKW